MAKDETDLDTGAAGGSGKKKLILIIVLAVVLVAVSVGATLFLTGALGGGGEKEAAHDEKGAAAQIKPALYLPLDPAFVVNFEDQSAARFLQVQLQVMARSQEAINAVQSHMPVIRNNILLLLSSQRYEEVSTHAGKEKLRKAIIDSINKVLHDAGSKEEIESVYYTGFVMQ